MLAIIFNELLFRPLLNLLILFYSAIPDFGLAIILLTILVRLLLFPLNQKALRSQKELAILHPKLKALQEKHKDHKELLAKATLGLYKEHKINPFTPFLTIILQIPILLALFYVFRSDINKGALKSLYNFVPHPGVIDQSFFGLINLAKVSIFLAILAGIVQFIQAKMVMNWNKAKPTPSLKGSKAPNLPDFASIMQKQTLYFFPILTTVFAFSFPAGLTLYWTVSTVFLIFQQYYLQKQDERKAKNHCHN